MQPPFARTRIPVAPPALEAVLNDFIDFRKVGASTGEAFWQRVAGILRGKIDPTMEGVDDALLKDYKEQIEAIYHDLRRYFVGQGIELDRMAETEPDPKEAANLYMTRIAAGGEYPKRLLFGSETGERASTEDMKSYFGSVEERRTQHAEPFILRPIIDRLIEYGALPRPRKDIYTVTWLPLHVEGERDLAESNRLRADAARLLTPVGGDPMDLVEIDEERNVWLKPKGADDPSPFAKIDDNESAAPISEEGNAQEGGGSERGSPVAENFDPNQARDDAGRWTKSGVGAGFRGAMDASAGNASEAMGYNKSAREAALGDPEAAAVVAGYDRFADDVALRKFRPEMQAAIDGNPTTPEAEAFVRAVAGAPAGAPEMYRGISLDGSPADVAARYSKGTVLDWSPSSFSTDRSVADDFSRKEFLDRPTRVVFRLQAGGSALKMENLSWAWSEREWVAMGSFEVKKVAVSKRSGLVEVDLAHVTSGRSTNRFWRWMMSQVKKGLRGFGTISESWSPNDPYDPAGEMASFAANREPEKGEEMRERREQFYRDLVEKKEAK